jgi:hypothetical protein
MLLPDARHGQESFDLVHGFAVQKAHRMPDAFITEYQESAQGRHCRSLDAGARIASHGAVLVANFKE